MLGKFHLIVWFFIGGLPGLLAQDAASLLPRYKVGINSHWAFQKGSKKTGAWQVVNIPHSWNTEDSFDETPGYYRGEGWYRKALSTNNLPDKARTYLYFEAANQTTDAWLNGQRIGNHKGGYTAFAFDLTEQLKENENILEVRVDNSHDPDIPPLKGDFNFYGGIYRDVYLILTGNTHFEILDHAAPGIYIRMPEVDSSRAEIQVRGNIQHHLQKAQKGRIRISIKNEVGEVIEQAEQQLTFTPGKNEFETALELENPNLWSPDNPYLYRVEATIIDDATQKVLDQIVQPLGVRWFSFEADEGFFLNGQHLTLRGVNRHQDLPGKANALSNEEHLYDIQMIKEMGANFLRTAHYPQDPAVLQACDRLGLLVSMEIPLDHDITDSEGFYEHSRVMMREMIRQYYNHPSIIVWAYMNEMFLGRKMGRDQEAIDKIVAFAKELEALTREEDPTRYTMIPNHGDFEVYHQSGLTQIPMIVGWNLYFGWYEERMEGFGVFMDRAHRELPEKPLMLTEYGAGADPRLRSDDPIRFDFSVDWASKFHQSHLIQLDVRPYIAASAVWNMFDFGSESRKDAVPHVNNKGLCTFDRQPKDAYYYYKAWLSEAPYLKLLPYEDEACYGFGGIAIQEVCAIGNVESATINQNGRALGERSLVANKVCWDIGVTEGIHTLKLESKEGAKDEETINYNVVDPVRPWVENRLPINMGTNLKFWDEAGQYQWLSEPPADQSNWIVGGEVYHPRNRGIGTDRDILGTTKDPLYQTQRIGIETFQLPLEAGKYRLSLLFAELENKQPGERKFAIQLNKRTLIPELDIAKRVGAYQALEKTYEVYLEDPGFIINFIPVEGEPVINAIQIQKIGY